MVQTIRLLGELYRNQRYFGGKAMCYEILCLLHRVEDRLLLGLIIFVFQLYYYYRISMFLLLVP